MGLSVCLLLLLLGLAAVYADCPNTQTYYVSPKGSDSNSGTIEAPFQTIGRARDVIARSPPTGAVTVYVRQGDYILQQPLLFTTVHSGLSAECPITYIAYPGEQVRLLGGIPVSGWIPADSSSFGVKLDPNVVQVNLLKSYNVTSYGQPAAHNANMLELFFNNVPMELARYPNRNATNPSSEWSYIKALVAGNTNAFVYGDARSANWVNAQDLWLHGYWTWDWSDSHVHVLSINTTSSTFNTDPSTPPQYGYTANRRYYAFNLIEELDQPGEYFLDRTTGILYFYPPNPIQSTDETFVSIINNIITLRNTSFITFDGLQMMFARSTGFSANTGVGVVIQNCECGNHGQSGIVLSGVSSSAAINNQVFYTGDAGISFSAGNRYTLTSGNVVVANNTIHDFARLDRTYQPGVGWSGVGNTVSGNEIYNGPHTAILGNGNNHVFEYNNVHDTCYETSDAGAFYTGRTWAARGNIVRYNSFKNVQNNQKTVSGGHVSCIYLDDQDSGYNIYGNTIVNCQQGVLLGGGRDNIFEDNTFSGNGLDIAFDDRGLNWQAATCAPGGMFETELKQYNYQQPPWSTAYPYLVNIMNEQPCTPVHNVIQGNTYCDTNFIDETATTIAKWNSTLGTNTYQQSC